MNKSLSEGLNTPFTPLQVGKEFSYQDYLREQAKLAALAIGQNNPQPTMFYLSHPKETYRHEYSLYQPIGEIYCNKPRYIPPKLLAEFDGNDYVAERCVVCIERLYLDPHFQRRGFLGALREELSRQRFRFLILSQVPNPEFASYLYAASREDDCIELLPDPATGSDWKVQLPTFLIRLN
jgi:hypothetical protein